MTDFNYEALELLKDAAVLAQRQELTELILLVSFGDESKAQVLTVSAGGSLVKLLMMVISSIEELGELLTLDSENLELLKEESNKLQQLLAKIGVS